jgi:hypothetical protein
MVDPGIAQVIIKHLNRWYRSRSQPRGVMDHYHRGTRMGFNRAYRTGNGLVALFLLGIGSLLFLIPDLFANKPLWQQWLVKLGWLGITVVAVLILLQLFRESTIVTDDGLVKTNLLGRITRMDWRELAQFSYKTDDSTVTFRNAARKKLTMSLCYNGWQDFLETAQRRMEPGLYWQVTYGLAMVKAGDQKPKAVKAPASTKWFSFGKRKKT